MTTLSQVATMDDTARARLAQFADVLIAGSPGWPSASAAGVHEDWMDRTFVARPDLCETVMAVLAIPGEPRAVVDDLRARDPDTFNRFSTAIAGTYLMNPRVRRQLGLPSGPPEPNPPYPDEAEYYLEGGLLDPVIARGGAMFRRTPAGR